MSRPELMNCAQHITQNPEGIPKTIQSLERSNITGRIMPVITPILRLLYSLGLVQGSHRKAFSHSMGLKSLPVMLKSAQVHMFSCLFSSSLSLFCTLRSIFFPFPSYCLSELNKSNEVNLNGNPMITGLIKIG